MNKESIALIKDVIDNWKQSRQYTYEQKQMYAYRSPIIEGEFVLRFSNKVTFNCNGKFSDVTLISRSYPTTTISDSPISRNRNADKEMLQILLKEFDTNFYLEVNKRIDECIETMQPTEGSFFE